VPLVAVEIALDSNANGAPKETVRRPLAEALSEIEAFRPISIINVHDKPSDSLYLHRTKPFQGRLNGSSDLQADRFGPGDLCRGC
jgi:hypothetical protein